ncbi:MAG: GH3 auxin-responsive promoter family protein [Cyanobacteria bacterium P01_F01_bin.150]
MASPIMSLLEIATAGAKRRLIAQTKQASQVQEEFLRSLLHAHQHTVLGQDYGLSALLEETDPNQPGDLTHKFRQQIPVAPYNHYEPYIERVAAGEPNIMTPDPVVYMNITSGSTGKQKLIPVTKRSRQALQRAQQASMGFTFAAARQRHLPIGKILLTSAVNLAGKTSGGIDYGPVSVGDLRLSNFLYKQVFVHPFDALRPKNSLARHYVCLLFALRDRNLRVIAANFPVLAVQLCQYLERNSQSLIQDIQQGAIADWLDLEPELRAILEPQLSPSVQRAEELQKIFDQDGRLVPKTAWPQLSFLITALGGTSNFYLQRFPEYFGDISIFGGVYSSAEATYGSYFDMDREGTILALNSGFFEFIPESEWDNPNPKTFLSHEIRPKERYRILVTNYSGFYRYDIGDVIEVMEFYNEAPVITFRHRRGGLLSSTTEKTTEFHAIQVMELLQEEFKVSFENFCITLSGDRIPPRYLVNVELAEGYSIHNPQHFLLRFDQQLQDIHRSYALKRASQVPTPRLRILESGSFSVVRQALIAKGVPESQLKFRHISGDRTYLQGVTIQEEICFPNEGE